MVEFHILPNPLNAGGTFSSLVVGAPFGFVSEVLGVALAEVRAERVAEKV